MKAETRLVKVFLPLDLIELLEDESKDYTSFNKMMTAVCRRYFLHRELKAEFAKLK